ncbi:hypothetical protein [Bacillus sp. 1P02SD]|uniref:hypothetical protein n=1 Tax=Bacillus sp. 1P02SD TaxID=3132264 RepID=UPI0039A01457
MNIKKGIVAMAIFAFLFIGAWVIHEQTKREYGESQLENQQQFQIQTINSTQTPEKSKVYPKFKPREYIRIER